MPLALRRLLSIASLGRLTALGGCLSIDALPIRPAEDAGADAAASCAHRGRPDPLVGRWTDSAGECEFFSNGRFTDDCNVLDHSGDPGEWSALSDGRYYFGALNAFNENIGQCTGKPSFAAGCGALTVVLDCSRGEHPTHTLHLTRVR